MEKIRNALEPYYKEVHRLAYENKSLAPVFEIFEKKTGFKREYLISGVICTLTLYLIFGYAAQLICNVIGFIYPAYMSVKALETKSKDDDTRWLTYWVVYASFSTCEFFTDILLSWFPFYWLAKCVFLIWCFLPGPRSGSLVVYSWIIKPFFIKNQAALEETFGGVQNRLDKIAGQVTDALSKAD